MKAEYASNNASLIRGYAWHVYPDPATPGVFAGDNPFGDGDAPSPGGPVIRKPEGVVNFWAVKRNVQGLNNDPPQDGNQPLNQSYVVLTEGIDRPPVTAGWFVETARLREEFAIDQRGDRWVRLVRILHTADTPDGPLQECEFQVDRT